MATFSTLNYKNRYHSDYTFYKVSGPLTVDDISSINRINNKIVIVFDNTKGQDPNIIRKINNPNVTISVLSGLDYLHKRKFQNTDYLERTFYQPNELASIIEFFQKMEKEIRYTWTPRQKAMYVYKTLAEYLHYNNENEDEWVNGRDITRSLTGLLYGRLVCSGFALVYKEAMDRLGIPCHYQNVCHTHCFNILELDGKYYGIDLTWDCYNKKYNDNKCGFANFGVKEDFYAHPDHNIESESEEIKYPLSTFSREEIIEDYRVISYQNFHERRPMASVRDSDDKLFVSTIKHENGIYHHLVFLHGSTLLIHSRKASDQIIAMDVFDAIQNKGWDPSIPEKERVSSVVEYHREDGSTFVVTKSPKGTEDMQEYYYFDVVTQNGSPISRRAALLSEMNLAHEWKEPIRGEVANKLLSRERLARKIKTTKGYVGYLGNDHSLYYNRDFERDNLHLVDHVH